MVFWMVEKAKKHHANVCGLQEALRCSTDHVLVIYVVRSVVCWCLEKHTFSFSCVSEDISQMCVPVVYMNMCHTNPHQNKLFRV